MRNFQDTSETRKRSFISAFLISMTAPLIINLFKKQEIKEATVPNVSSLKTSWQKNFNEKG